LSLTKVNLCGSSQFGQSQIYSFERQNFTRTKPLVLTKKQVVDIAFSLKTQATKAKVSTTWLPQ